MKQSELPLWKKSMLAYLNLSDMYSMLYEIAENGDSLGYDTPNECEYYYQYAELFTELSVGANEIMMGIDEITSDYEYDEDKWNALSVDLLGRQEEVLGYDPVQEDYFAMLDPNSRENQAAIDEAEKKCKRMTKSELLKTFKQILTTITLFYDIKSAHDCLTAVVIELEEKGALLEKKNDEINRLYKDLTGSNEKEFDRLIAKLPQRMWVE